jgi:aryl-phospho-beta-D-glucosidase BglC (GH1 family)
VGTNISGQALRGCALEGGSPPAIAPGGYYTNGATVCTANGTPHLFHGIDRPSLEWDPQGEFANSEGIPASDFQAMASWHANIVRIALNQDFWLSGAALHSASYQDTVDRAVHDAEAAGLDVILDLHWSDDGNLGVGVSGKTQNCPTNSNQQQMADVNSQQFWSEVAAKYASDGHVLFELYNEPNQVAWDVWLNGGTVSTTAKSCPVTTYQVVGMQQLYDTVRQAGANNVVIAGGLNWAFDLSGVQFNPIRGYNIMYATHPYNTSGRGKSTWPGSFGYLAANDVAPVIATEFGDGSMGCTGQWDSDLIAFAAQYKISWTAWGWWVGGCSFPALLSAWNYTPTDQGQAVKMALANDPPVTPRTMGDGGTDGAGDSSADSPTDSPSATDSPTATESSTPTDAPTADASDAATVDDAEADGGSIETGSDASPD